METPGGQGPSHTSILGRYGAPVRSPLPLLRRLTRRAGPVGRLDVGLSTFHWAHERLDEIADERAKDRPAVSAFDPAPLATAPTRLRQWTDDLRRAAAPLRVIVDAPGDDLLDLLQTLAAHVDSQNEAHLLRLLGVLTGGVFRGPATFHLDVANACNVNCAYCWFHSPGSKKRADAHLFDSAWRSDQVPWETFTGLIDDLDELGGREDVLLSGKGEPLLHPRCLDMVAYVKQRGLGLTLFSNGVLVREEAREALVAHGCDLLYVSLSSATPAVYEAIHPGHPGEEELGEVLDNVRALTELKRARGRQEPRVMMVDVLCSANAHEALDFYEQARDIGAEHVRFQLIHVQDYNAHLKLRPDQIAPLRAQIAEAQRRATAGGPSIVDNIHYQLETVDPESGLWGHGRTPDGVLRGLDLQSQLDQRGRVLLLLSEGRGQRGRAQPGGDLARRPLSALSAGRAGSGRQRGPALRERGHFAGRPLPGLPQLRGHREAGWGPAALRARPLRHRPRCDPDRDRLVV